jgi:glycosyltransferase involved in cell wall biosynthesis
LLYKLADTLFDPYRKWAEQKTLSNANRHIFISGVCEKGWENNYKIISPTSIIYNGVDRSVFHPRNIDNDESILYVGDSERKGLSRVLEFARQSDQTIRIVGEVSSSIANVECVGRVSQDKLAKLYSKASVTIHPAKFEAFGNVVLESLSCGTPVVTTPKCGASEILTEDTGIVTSEIQKGVNRCYDLAREDCIELSKEYTWDRVAERTINIAKKIV